MKSNNPNTKITHNRTAAITIQTIFLGLKVFFFSEEAFSEVDGPSAGLLGLRWEGGDPETGGAPGTEEEGGDGATVDVGGDREGAIVSLNGFPSFLHKTYQFGKHSEHQIL